MNTYKITTQDGRVFAFEIENVYISVQKIATILHSRSDISDINVRKPFSANRDIHIEFMYKGKIFIVWEPYGDSSRYWIGPKDETQEDIDLTEIEHKFIEYQPAFITKVLGDLITFKFLSFLSVLK